ncbi:MAG: CHAP domain-containing protein, partial [Nocardioides sp.]|nr:CHAP domain-containing protein [Nocardioides sp.]
RTLEQRQAAWRGPLGAARSGVRTQGQVRYRDFARGIVAQRGRNASIVQGTVLRAYRNAGGVGGRLGAPLADQHCQLLGTGCLQRFERGAIYVDPQGQRKVNVVRGRPGIASYIAVGRSQVGYVEPSRGASKFNAWIGNDNPWCGFFQAWVSRASGNGDWFPKAVNFRRQVAKLESRGTRIARPRVGSVVFFDYRGWNRPSHVGFVTAVHANGTITTLEGNTGPRNARGVKESVRGTSQVHSYWLPREP